jgi:hypothetical protein
MEEFEKLVAESFQAELIPAESAGSASEAAAEPEPSATVSETENAG